uniref:Uncharacterized protein n=1 Tax=Globodera rostochiensis TaxID=31243 RepID=A0A914I503_GLORO
MRTNLISNELITSPPRGAKCLSVDERRGGQNRAAHNEDDLGRFWLFETTPAFDYICRRWTIDPRRTLMVGDRLNTDVKFGNDHGLRTMLVLSGCHGVDDILDSQMQGRDDLLPDFYANSLGSLMLQVHGCANKTAATDTCNRAAAFV